MSLPPWLLTSGPWQRDSEIGKRSLHRLGETAAFLQTPGAIDLLAEAIHDHSQKEGGVVWGAAVAREILLCCSVHPALLDPLFKAISPVGFLLVPFVGGPPIETIFDLEVKVAASLIPLQANGGKSAAFGQIWVVRSPIIAASRLSEITRQRLVEGLPPKGSEMETLILVTDDDAPERIEGRSWELGAHLAARACDGLARGNSEPALALARDWIVTGAVDAESEDVLQIGMRGKLTLADTSPRRDWLLPAANQSTIPPEFESKTAGRLHYSIDTAFLSGEELDWNNPPLSHPKEFHCFASIAMGPLLASVLWSQPERVVIWSPQSMRSTANQFRKVCETLRQELICTIKTDQDICILNIGNSSLPEIRNSLLTHASLGGGGPAPTLFNITGGNLLMRIALVDLARTRPHIHLIYRQEATDNTHFVYINHPYFQPVAAKVCNVNISCSDSHMWSEKLLNLHLKNLHIDESEWANVIINAAQELAQGVKSNRPIMKPV